MFVQFLAIALWLFSFQCISFLIGFQHTFYIENWYVFLYRSSLTPPGYIFSIVWPLLYCLLAIVGYLLWHHQMSFRVKLLYGIQMLLNWSWTTLFFRCHLILLSWVFIVLMVALTLLIMIKTYKKMPIVTWLLVPYFGWLCFAWYLNFFIWLYN